MSQLRPVYGREVVLEMLVSGVYYPVLCATDCSFTRSPEVIEKTSPSSGLFKEFMTRREEWSMSVSGLTKIENAAALTFFYILQTSVRRLAQDIRITFTDSDGDSKQITGTVLIGEQIISGPASDFSNCSIEMKGTGAFAIADTAPPIPGTFDIFSDYWQTVNGQSYIDGASSGTSPAAVANGGAFTLAATNDEILEVSLEGDEYDVILSGTPGNRQCKFTTSPVRITFQAGVVFDGTQRVFVEFKRTT